MNKELAHVLLPVSLLRIYSIASLEIPLDHLCFFLEIGKTKENVAEGNVLVIPKLTTVSPGVASHRLAISPLRAGSFRIFAASYNVELLVMSEISHSSKND